MKTSDCTSSSNNNIVIREVTTPDELKKTALEWASQEGWNPAQQDYVPYYTQDPHGFLLLLLDDKPIGAISIVKYSEQFSFIGLFIVLPDYRNRGYGTMLWNEAMRKVAENSTVGLYAVPQQIKRYRDAGFFKHHMNQRRVLRNSPEQKMETPLVTPKENPEMQNKLFAYDQRVWGASRQKMLAALLSQLSTYAFVTTGKDTGQVTAYGIIRPCIKGYRIGPLYADTPDNAKQLTEALLTKIPKGSEIIFDIPDTNKFGELFSEYFGLERFNGADTQAMYTTENFDSVTKDSEYALASLELG